MHLDAHVHFWKYDRTRLGWIDKNMKVLQKDYLPTDLSGTLARNDMDGVIAVQAEQSEVETLFLIELAKTHPIIKGVIGWVDLQAPNVGERLDYFMPNAIIRGYRHIAQSEPDDFFYGEDFRRGLTAVFERGYAYDLLVFPRQLKATVDLVNAFPGERFVLDHCGKPEIKNKKLDDWKQQIKELGAHPNVYCKLSGLFTEAEWKSWSAGDFYPYLDVVFDVFGTDRLMFGTDWPVMLLSGMYVQWKSLLEKYMENMNEEVKDNVFGWNAMRMYQIVGSR